MLSGNALSRIRYALGNKGAADEFIAFLQLQGVLPGGNVYWASSTRGSDTTKGGTASDDPRATLESALGRCTALNGDSVILMPYHNEGMGNDQWGVGVAGVAVIGLGRGGQRPRLDYDHAGASMDITANDVLLQNLTFLPSVTDVTIGIDVNAAALRAQIIDCEALVGEDGAGVDDFALWIDVKAGCDGLKVVRPRLRQHASGAGYLAGIRLTGASDDITIEDPDMVMAGVGLVAPINGITTLSTNVDIVRGRLTTDAEPGIEMLTGTTGRIIQTVIFGDLGTIDEATVADGMAHFDVKYVEVGNEAGTLVKTESVDD